MSHFLLVLLVSFVFGFIALSKGFDFDALAGRKDPDTCCDKLDNNTFSTSCQQTLLQAGALEKFAYSPGFPNEFPPNKLCSWGIYAKAGKRIRLEFRDFYLIGPSDDGDCLSQGIVIKSPLSGLQIGPHCGNAGLPSIVSAGNYLVVELISNIPMTSEGFRGFRMSYVESIETPSHELRPANWANDVILTVDPITIEKLFPVVTPAATRKSPKPTRKSSKFSPSRRPILPVRPFGPPRGYPNRIVNDRLPPTEEPLPYDSTPVLSTEIIVGIAVGGVIVLAVLILILVTCLQARKLKRENQSRQKSEEMRMEQQQGEYNHGYQYTDPNGIPQEPPPGYYFTYYDEEDNVAKYHTNEKPKSPVKKEPNSPPRYKGEKTHSRKKQRRVRNLRTISMSARARMVRKDRKKRKDKERRERVDENNEKTIENVKKGHCSESRQRTRPSPEKVSRSRHSKSGEKRARKPTEKSSNRSNESSKSGGINSLKHGRPSSRDYRKEGKMKDGKSSTQRRRTHSHKHESKDDSGKKRTSTSRRQKHESRNN